MTQIDVDVTFSQGNVKRLPEDQCPDWNATCGDNDANVHVHVHLGDSQPALTQQQVTDIAHRICTKYGHSREAKHCTYLFTPHHLMDFLAAIEAAKQGGNHHG